MNENWCGQDDCPHCQGHDNGPEGSRDCPSVVCPECEGEVYNPPGISEGHSKCKGFGIWLHKI